VAYEDFATAKQSLIKFSKFNYAMACFGHGKPIVTLAAQRIKQFCKDKISR
jgi:hypothetical protein